MDEIQGLRVFDGGWPAAMWPGGSWHLIGKIAGTDSSNAVIVWTLCGRSREYLEGVDLDWSGAFPPGRSCENCLKTAARKGR